MKPAAALLLATSLASCGTPGMFPTPGQAYIKDITVTSPASEALPPDLAPRVEQKLAADRLSLPQTGAPQHVSIVVLGYHQKDALRSLLIGDNNRMASTMTVTSDDKATPPRTVPLFVTGNGAVNGVIGAVIAASQKDDSVQDTMSGLTSSMALEQFYGTKLLQTYRSTPHLADAAPVVPAPAAAPAPEKPKTKAAKRHAVKNRPATS